jgi:hypothetical protein
MPKDPWPNEPSPSVPFGRIVPVTCRYEGNRVMLNRHFQYRSPDQIRRRFQTRRANQALQGIFAPQWVDRPLEWIVRPESEHRFWDDSRYLSNLSPQELFRVLKWSMRAKLATSVKLFIDRRRRAFDD